MGTTKKVAKKKVVKKKARKKKVAKKKGAKKVAKKKVGRKKSTRKKKEGVMGTGSYGSGDEFDKYCKIRPIEDDKKKEMQEILKCLVGSANFRETVLNDPIWLTQRGLTEDQLITLIAVGECLYVEGADPARGYRFDPKMPGMCCCTTV